MTKKRPKTGLTKRLASHSIWKKSIRGPSRKENNSYRMPKPNSSIETDLIFSRLIARKLEFEKLKI